MYFERPQWYVTPREFANMVADAVIDQKFFQENDTAHPEDIAVAFSTVADSLVKGMVYAVDKIEGRVINQSKTAIMTSKDLKKNKNKTDDLRSSGYL